jgi:hypothetical protein
MELLSAIRLSGLQRLGFNVRRIREPAYQEAGIAGFRFSTLSAVGHLPRKPRI